ncbi:MAG TPA: c-type cytochrome [Nocardioidaceae bacterium]|nr:c-type cytochrome [Nocardioidaceae bacterium]
MRRGILTGVLAAVLAAAAAVGVFFLLDSGQGEPASGVSAATGPGETALAPAAFDQEFAPQPEAYEDLVARGGQVYAANCFVCHGGVGNGEGPWAPTLSTPARDFTDSPWMESQSDGVFFTSILRGVPGTPMPSFAGRLSEADIWAVTAYIRGFSPHVRLDDSSSDERLVGQGREVYAAQCAGCHGDQGAGDGDAAALFDTPPRALADGDWLSGRSDQQLHSTIVEGVPGTSMPSFYDELDNRQIDAVIAYLRVLADVEPEPNPLVGWAEESYRAYCASCHGVDGDGQGIAAGRIEPSPRSFRNPTWMAGQTDEKLVDAVTHGRPGTAMPPFGALLSNAEIARLVEYIRAFSSPEAIPGADSAYRYDPTTVPGTPSDDQVRPSKG